MSRKTYIEDIYRSVFSNLQEGEELYKGDLPLDLETSGKVYYRNKVIDELKRYTNITSEQEKILRNSKYVGKLIGTKRGDLKGVWFTTFNGIDENMTLQDLRFYQ